MFMLTGVGRKFFVLGVPVSIALVPRPSAQGFKLARVRHTELLA